MDKMPKKEACWSHLWIWSITWRFFPFAALVRVRVVDHFRMLWLFFYCSLIHCNYSSARKLVKLDAVQFVLNNHTVCLSFMKNSLGKLVCCMFLHVSLCACKRNWARKYRRKTSRSRLENYQTQSSYNAGSGNRTRVTWVGGECSYHWAIPAALLLPSCSPDPPRWVPRFLFSICIASPCSTWRLHLYGAYECRCTGHEWFRSHQRLFKVFNKSHKFEKVRLLF